MNEKLEILKHVDSNDYYKLFDLEIPISFEKLIDFFNIEISSELDSSKSEYAGEIKVTEDKVKIWVNPADAPVRQRFTIAHEIGHYVLHHTSHTNSILDDNIVFNRSAEWSKQESEANNFAARLLMPSEKVIDVAKEIINEYKEKNNSSKMPVAEFVRIMADKFFVSTTAMEYRLKNLGIIK